MTDFLAKLWDRMNQALSRLSDSSILLTRLVVGFVFVHSGWGKFHHLDQVIEFFASLGLPAPQLQAPFVAGCEMLFGTLLMVGLAARLACLPLLAIMGVAIFTAKREDIGDLNDLLGVSEFLYVVLLLNVLTQGPGRYSLDRGIRRRMREF